MAKNKNKNKNNNQAQSTENSGASSANMQNETSNRKESGGKNATDNAKNAR